MCWRPPPANGSHAAWRGVGAQSGEVIVSGLARGIDAAAHEGGLPSGTIAVLGGGVDDIYPPEHAGLYARIVEAGCVVSENEPGRTAVARDFPRRNRIISGLSRAVVVVEAEFRSGSLITARLAAEQGRAVLAVPGSPLDPRAKGTNDLIRQGAALCEGAEDVLRALEGLRGFREPDRWGYDALLANDPGRPELGSGRVAALLAHARVPRRDRPRHPGLRPRRCSPPLVELSLAGRCELASGGMVLSSQRRNLSARRRNITARDWV